jgi:hypothetical protein
VLPSAVIVTKSPSSHATTVGRKLAWRISAVVRWRPPRHSERTRPPSAGRLRRAVNQLFPNSRMNRHHRSRREGKRLAT